jgi:cytochrome c oxidase assembly protein subunit 15
MRLYSIFTFIFTFFVIIWGALVRATHSGAGCGKHWPLCNGEVVPLGAEIETIIEFTHRTTSGLSFVFVLILFFLSRKIFSVRSLTRVSANYALFFMLIEVAIGASLVLFGWVKDNSSGIRAFMVAFHLINSFLLMGSLAAHTLSLYKKRTILLKKPFLLTNTIFSRCLLIAFLITGSAGAITALGDTLFPPESLRGDFYNYLSPTNHFLVQLRIIHPILAIVISLFILLYGIRMSETRGRMDNFIPLLAYGVILLTLLQWIVGPLTILLLAPLPLQLTHLGVSLLLWTMLVPLALEDEFEHY